MNATPLLLAAAGGHKEVVEVLTAYGAPASDEDAVLPWLFSFLSYTVRIISINLDFYIIKYWLLRLPTRAVFV